MTLTLSPKPRAEVSASLSGQRKPETMRTLYSRPVEERSMSDAIAYLSRAIEQGQGLAKADLVLRGGRILDPLSRGLLRTHAPVSRDPTVGPPRENTRPSPIHVPPTVTVPAPLA